MVIDLIRAHSRGSEDDFGRIVEEIAMDEDKKGNSVLASDIRKAYRNMPVRREETDENKMSLQYVGDKGSTDNEFVEIITPDVTLDDIILEKDVRSEIESVIVGHKKRNQLPKGIKPITRIIMSGPPGCGKTMTAEAIAKSLGLRLAYVRIDTLISMYMGKTGYNLGSVFDYANRMGCVLFLDEFDAIARDRRLEDNGESKRILSTILQRLDILNQDTIVIAATNMLDQIDPAIIRRFDIIIKFGSPTKEGMGVLIDMMMGRYLPGREYSSEDIIDSIGQTNYASLKQYLETIIRNTILDGYEGKIDYKRIWNDASDEKSIEQIAIMHESGISLRRIEELTGIPRSTISYRLRKYYDEEQ